MSLLRISFLYVKGSGAATVHEKIKAAMQNFAGLIDP
jgi:hypothetical protein